MSVPNVELIKRYHKEKNRAADVVSSSASVFFVNTVALIPRLKRVKRVLIAQKLHTECR